MCRYLRSAVPQFLGGFLARFFGHSFDTPVSRLVSGWFSGLSFGLAASLLCVPAFADGVAVFASLKDRDSAEQMRTRLATALDLSVEDSEVDINGTRWIRLHSAVMSEKSARDLVSSATGRGYSAWFNGTGDSVVTSSSAAAATAGLRSPIAAPLVDNRVESGVVNRGEDRFSRSGEPLLQSGEPLSRSGESRWQPAGDSHYDVVTPATGDISHLPMAETFPLEDAN